eukprot:gene19777-22483_t
MMDYTDRHQRHLQRLLSKESVLYTEMVTSMAMIRSGDSERFLRADIETENPLVLQLGGNDPAEIKEASKLATAYGYNEVNLNIGCPSEKVSGAGCFGAVLYLNPPLVAELALAVYEATQKPATIKCRIGVNDHESYEELCNFIRLVSEVGKVEHFIIHARIAVLGKKFTPKDNRSIPTLKYDVVYRLVKDFPHLKFTLNGGVRSLAEVQTLLSEHSDLHGVMVGRAVVDNPFEWSRADSLLYQKNDPGLSRLEVLTQYAKYCAKEQESSGTRFTRTLLKPIHHLFHSQPQCKAFKQSLNNGVVDKLSAYEAIMRAAEIVSSSNINYVELCEPDETQEKVQEVQHQ